MHFGRGWCGDNYSRHKFKRGLIIKLKGVSNGEIPIGCLSFYLEERLACLLLLNVIKVSKRLEKPLILIQ